MSPFSWSLKMSNSKIIIIIISNATIKVISSSFFL